jgi:predicted MFS family arabinose efflux permease
VLGSAIIITGMAAAVYVIGIPIIQEDLTYGLLGLGALGAVLGLGWFSGSIVIGTLGNRFRKGTLLFSGFFLIGSILMVNPLIQTFAAASVAALLGGIALAAVFITLNTLLHEHLQEELRGRIFGIREWVNNGSFLLSAGLFGLLARYIESRYLLLGLGSVILLPSAGALLHRRFRQSLGIDRK